jgi:hypothetical protein
LNKIKFVIAIVFGLLIISVIFNVHYYVNLRRQNENVLHNMRGRALWTYASEVVTVAYFLDEYLETLDSDLLDKEVSWGIARAMREADILIQGLSEDSGLIYYELRRTAWALESYFVGPYARARINTTKVATIAQALRAIHDPFVDFDMLKNEEPIERLEEYSRAGFCISVDEVISYCQQIQEIVA